jgi:hypothetical protein
MENVFNYIKDQIPAIITSLLMSGIVSTIISGIKKRKNSIFERKQKAFQIIINKVVSFIHDIHYVEDLNENLPISKESYLNFKLEIDRYVLYLNKKEMSTLDEIMKLFARNINIDDVCGCDPDDPDYKLFSEEDRKQIIKLKDELLFFFKRELGIVKL